jgi:hypothetical protein
MSDPNITKRSVLVLGADSEEGVAVAEEAAAGVDVWARTVDALSVTTHAKARIGKTRTFGGMGIGTSRVARCPYTLHTTP